MLWRSDPCEVRYCSRNREHFKPLRGLEVDATIGASEDLFGYVVADLQKNVKVNAKSIEGELNYIADYSSAYGSGQDSGHYLVLHCSVPDVTGVTIQVEVVGGVNGPTTLDESGINIFRITNKNSQTIKVVASKEGYNSVTKIFTLAGLTLTPQADAWAINE